MNDKQCIDCDYLRNVGSPYQYCAYYLDTGRRRDRKDGKCLSKTKTGKRREKSFDILLPQMK